MFSHPPAEGPSEELCAVSPLLSGFVSQWPVPRLTPPPSGTAVTVRSGPLPTDAKQHIRLIGRGRIRDTGFRGARYWRRHRGGADRGSTPLSYLSESGYPLGAVLGTGSYAFYCILRTASTLRLVLALSRLCLSLRNYCKTCGLRVCLTSRTRQSFFSKVSLLLT